MKNTTLNKQWKQTEFVSKENVCIPVFENKDKEKNTWNVDFNFLQEVARICKNEFAVTPDLKTIESVLLAANNLHQMKKEQLTERFLSIPAPANILMYLNKKTSYFEKTEDGIYAVDIDNGKNPTATFFFDENDTSEIHVRLDYVESIRDLHLHLLELGYDSETAIKMTDTLEKIQDKLYNALKKYDFEWLFSHKQDSWLYAWYDLTMKTKDFDVLGFEECWDIIGEFEKELIKLHNSLSKKTV